VLISVYRLGEMRIQSCGQSVSAWRGKRYTEISLLRIITRPTLNLLLLLRTLRASVPRVCVSKHSRYT